MFSILTEPNYPKAAIGLEREAVTALLLQKEGRGQFYERDREPRIPDSAR